MQLSYTQIDTPVGDFYVFFKNKNLPIVVLSGFGKLSNLKKNLPNEFKSCKLKKEKNNKYKKIVKLYFNGNIKVINEVFSMQDGSKFQKKVWEKIKTISPGKPITYKKLAKKIKKINAVRAVGSACGKNKIALFIPCHRVIKSNGEYGKYLFGNNIKKYLLEHEDSFMR